jgi:Fe2+ or Zn2+ uptake regulation protein
MSRIATSSSRTPSGLDCRLTVLGRAAKLTPHRRAVFQTLSESTDHPTALDLFTRIKDRSADISLATVYNCLEHLTTNGLINKSDVAPDAPIDSACTDAQHAAMALGDAGRVKFIV